MKVLLVEDDSGTRETLAIALRHAGLDVKTARDGAGAAELLRAEAFDWMITDGQLGSISGLHLSLEAKRLRPEIRTVLISGVCDEDDIVRYPIERFFAKPVDCDELAQFLREGESRPRGESLEF